MQSLGQTNTNPATHLHSHLQARLLQVHVQAGDARRRHAAASNSRREQQTQRQQSQQQQQQQR
jgi:hypothetical protein